MTEFKVDVVWKKQDEDRFVDSQFYRGHQWKFDGGITVDASPSPHVVPLPLSCEEAVDPEEAFVAAISSCHMLTFLAIAAKRRYVVLTY